MQTISELWRSLLPLVQQEIAKVSSRAAGTSGGLSTHALDGAYHSGSLGDSQAPQFAKLDGSRAFTGNLTFVGAQTVDGVDISAHAANASAHHAPVTAGTLIGLSGQQVSVANGSAQYQVPVTGASPFAPAFTALSGMAGGGLTFGSGAFAVGAGTLISVGANDISLANGSAQYQVPVTGASPFTPAYTALSGMAGDGLTFGSGAFAVGVANTGATGLTVEANAVRLTSSNNTGAAAAILATDATGMVTVPHVVGGTDVATPLLKTASGNLTITPAGTNVNITNGKTLQSNYVSGWAGSGYRIDSNVSLSGESFLELDDISVRGTLNVYELLVNQIRATNGTEIVSSVAKLASVSGSTWTFENADGANLCPFAVGDIVLIQRATVAAGTLIKRIVRKVASVTGASITVGTATGGPADTDSPEKGDTVVRIGSETNANRRGSILLTSDMSNAPYIDVISGVALWSDWGGSAKTKMRLGLLTGITSTANEYGLIAGSGYTATDSYIKLSSSAVLQNNVPSTWKASGVDFLKIDATNGVQFVLGTNNYNGVTWYDSVGGTAFASVKALNDGTYDQISLNSVSPTGGYTSYVAVKSYSSGSVLELKTADATNSATHTFTGTSVTLNTNRLSLSNIGTTQRIHLTHDWQNLTNANFGTTDDSEISNDDGTYKALMLSGNRADTGSYRRIMLLDHVHVGSNALGSTAFQQQITGGNTDRIFSLAVNAYGRSTAIMANAYKSADGGHLFTSGQATYYGGQAAGTAPLMFHLDPNAVEWKWYYGPTNLASGASITSWTQAAKLTTTYFGANALRTLAEGVDWKLSGYTAGAPAATGYVLVNVNGTNYKLLTST